METTAREQATSRLYITLQEELLPRVRPEMWGELAPGGLVDRADLALARAAGRYERHEASRDEVIAAAEELRTAWRSAVHRYTRSGGHHA